MPPCSFPFPLFQRGGKWGGRAGGVWENGTLVPLQVRYVGEVGIFLVPWISCLGERFFFYFPVIGSGFRGGEITILIITIFHFQHIDFSLEFPTISLVPTHPLSYSVAAAASGISSLTSRV